MTTPLDGGIGRIRILLLLLLVHAFFKKRIAGVRTWSINNQVGNANSREFFFLLLLLLLLLLLINWRMPLLGDLNESAISLEGVKKAVNEMKSIKVPGGLHLWTGVVHSAPIQKEGLQM